MPAIAVLPFADMSPGKDQDYLSDGIAEEILESLAHVEGLRVIGRTSSFAFKGRNEDLRAIGEKLGVAHLLEGSVRKSGGRIRVTAQLVEAGHGSHLWSERYDRELNDVFTIEDEIARSVVSALRLKLLSSQVRIGRRSMKADASNEYLLGRQFARSGSKDGSRRAIAAFEKALALDPEAAPAWAELALARDYFAGYFEESLVRFAATEEAALAAAEKAIALDPDLPAGYQARGHLRSGYNWDWLGAEADLDRALALNPGDSDILVKRADLLASTGRLPLAITLLRKALDLDPLRARSWSFLGYLYRGTGELGLARMATNRALEISPELAYASCGLGEISLLEGDSKAALDSYQRCAIPSLRWTGLAWSQHDLGHEKESREALDALVTMSEGAAYQIAQVHAWRREPGEAFDWLERARLQRDAGLRYVKYDPFLRKIRGDPRYVAFLQKMNLPAD